MSGNRASTGDGAGFPRIRPHGEQGLLIEFGEAFAPEVSRAVLAFDRELATAPPWIVETAPTIRSVAIRFDPEAISPEDAEAWCGGKLAGRDWLAVAGQPGRRWTIPAVYGGVHGPDLDEFAEIAGLAPARLIELHCSLEMSVLCLGFSPGLAYVGELPEAFAVPRRESHGSPVPAGSILVANRQTVLPATPIPTGWWRIAASPLATFRPGEADPFLLSPGDRVRFAAIDAERASRFRDAEFWEARRRDGT